MQYRYVCVAGTFDGLHVGHEAMLKRAFTEGKRVLIGLTSDIFVSQWKKTTSLPVSAYEPRKKALTQWIEAHTWLDRATIVPIDDPYGPAVSDAQLDALVVSEESYERGRAVNTRRAALGIPELALIVVPLVQAEDKKPVSASRVREGEIDRTGKLIMPDFLRDELAQPLGKVLMGQEVRESFARHLTDQIISVGDLTTKTLLDAGITPQLMIIDNKVNRKVFTDLAPIIAERDFPRTFVKSGPGFMSSEAINAINVSLQNPSPGARVIEVEGEEDLLVIPAILAAPIGYVLYYGQPPVSAWACGPELSGIVEVVITDERKKVAQALLRQFLR